MVDLTKNRHIALSPSKLEKTGKKRRRSCRICCVVSLVLGATLLLAFVAVTVVIFVTAAQVGKSFLLEPETQTIFFGDVSPTTSSRSTTIFTRATAKLKSKPVFPFISPHILAGIVRASINGKELATFPHEPAGIDHSGVALLHIAQPIAYDTDNLVQAVVDLSRGRQLELQLALDTKVEVLEHLPSLPLKETIVVRPQGPSLAQLVATRFQTSLVPRAGSRVVEGLSVSFDNPLGIELGIGALEGFLRSPNARVASNGRPQGLRMLARPANLMRGRNTWLFIIADGTDNGVTLDTRGLTFTFTAAAQNDRAVPIAQRLLDMLQISIPVS